MPQTNFPSGVASYGIPIFGQGTMYEMPCDDIWFVCNAVGTPATGGAAGTSRTNPFQSIADALARADTDDVVFVLAGHAENVTASNVFSGTAAGGPNTGAQVIPINCRIIGEGTGPNRPVLTFTAAASTIALASASSTLENFNLQGPQTGTTTVAAMITVTAAGCKVKGNTMQLASSATALCTTGISISAAATDFEASYNIAYATTGTPTSWMAPTGTVGANRVYILNNIVQLPLSATTGGCVDLTANSGTAPDDWVIGGNLFRNKTTSSTVALKGVSGCGGMVVENYLGIAAASGGATAINTPGNWNMDESYGGVIGKSGIVITPQST